MKVKNMVDALNDVEFDLVEQALEERNHRKQYRIKWVAAVACLFLVVGLASWLYPAANRQTEPTAEMQVCVNGKLFCYSGIAYHIDATQAKNNGTFPPAEYRAYCELGMLSYTGRDFSSSAGIETNDPALNGCKVYGSSTENWIIVTQSERCSGSIILWLFQAIEP